MTPPRPESPRAIGILAVPAVQLLDVSGPLDVFAEANAQAGKQAYQLRVIATVAGPIVSSSGVRLLPDAIIGEKRAQDFHTLLVAGAPNVTNATSSARVTDWLREAARKSKRYGSVCSGAFLLGEAGLLKGRRVTTHWAIAQQLALTYPAARVEADAIHMRDGKLRTAAGVTAGLDLALALVEEDLGREVATRVAAQLVMYFKRPGGQLQFSRARDALPAGRSALQELQRWVAAHPALDHSVRRLAARLGLSTRHFTRLFTHEIGMSPATWVEQIRIAGARRLLETGEAVPKQVASECGFSSIDTFRRAFARLVGVTPAEYRKRFRDEGA
jgi:transcriptional regulator GlxA family with amidase domain